MSLKIAVDNGDDNHYHQVGSKSFVALRGESVEEDKILQTEFKERFRADL